MIDYIFGGIAVALILFAAFGCGYVVGVRNRGGNS